MRAAALLFSLLVGIIPVSAEEKSASAINEAAGLPIFPASGTLWEEDAAAVAKRLGLPLESQTSGDASYRLYTNDEVRVFGLRPYSVALSAQDGKPAALSIIFSNKGDSVGQFARAMPGQRAPRASKVLRDYRRAIRDDDEALEQMLGELLGPATQEKTDSGGRMQERSRRRDWNGHALLLVSVRDEYVAVRIVPPLELDATNSPQRIPAKELRERLASRVERCANGDTVIRDIPMVDQGPKGFCVPATMERMLRHLGIPADMYLLAMAANTDPGGGTSVPDVIAAVHRTAKRHGRDVTILTGKPEISALAKWIDQGVPVLWAINTSDQIDDMVNARTRERHNVADWAEWKESLKNARRGARQLSRSGSDGHVCLITGYNAETAEIALSDSWGPGYEERWLTEEEAGAISQGSMAVVAW